MTILRSIATRNAEADLLATLLNAGPAAGTMKLYTGPMPASPDTPVTTQVLLATLTLIRPPAPPASAGILTLSTMAPVAAIATGIVAWARFADSTGAPILDADVTLAVDGGSIIMTSLSLIAGNTVTVTAMSMTVPA